MGAFGNSGITRFLLTSLLLLNAVSATPVSKNPAAPTTPATEIFEGVTRPAPAPGPEMEWVFNQPSPDETIRTVFDLETIDLESSLRAFLSTNAYLVGDIAPKRISLSAALDAVRAMFSDKDNQAALATLRHQPGLQSIDALQNLAAAALATGRPRWAVGALWLAEERWPGDPRVRFNLASLLAQHGSVNEAEALLDDLVARNILPSHPFGITSAQGADHLRAYIWMRQGRVKEAAALFRPIVAANPAFAEADLCFALLQDKLGEDPRAAYIAGVWRRPSPPRPSTKDTHGAAQPDQKTVEKPDEPELVGLEAPLFVDISKGQPGVLPAIVQPVEFLDRIQYGNWCDGAVTSLAADFLALEKNRSTVTERWRGKDVPAMVRERFQALERIIDDDNASMAEIKVLLRAIARALEDKGDARERLLVKLVTTHLEMSADPNLKEAEKCARLRDMTDQLDAAMRVHVQAYDYAVRRRYRAWHQYATALGSLTTDPDFRKYLDIQIKMQANVDYSFLILNMADSCGGAKYFQEHCRASGKTQQTNSLGQAEEDTLAKCSEEQAKNSVGAGVKTEGEIKKTPVEFSLGVELTCDGISIEAGASVLSFIGLSGEIEFKTNGTTTIYIGPKTTLGAAGLGGEVSSKVGLFLSMDKDSFTDAGGRSVQKATLTREILNVQVTASHTISDEPISFFPGPGAATGRHFGLADFPAPCGR